MKVQSIDLIWIVVKDLKKAIKFYTEVVGLKVMQLSEEHGWAELQGHERGARLGIAQMEDENFKAGKNAVVTFTVENIDQAKREVVQKGGKCLGDIQEVPGHVKIQTVVDADGNQFQLVQMLS